MSNYDKEAEDAIQRAASEVTEELRELVLRHLVAKLSERGYNQFYTLDVADFLQVYRLGMDSAVAIIRQLAANGHVEITHKAGEDASYTHFSLTEHGFQLGSPKTGRSLRDAVFRSKFQAILFVGGVFGIGGGVLGLASIWSSITGYSWQSTIEPVLFAWENYVRQPIREVVSIPLLVLDLPRVPKWIADYLGLGILIRAASVRASQFHELKIGPVFAKKASVGLKERLRNLILWIVANVFFVLIWPYVAFFEIGFMGWYLITYLRDPSSIDELSRTLLPPDKVFLRWVCFTTTFLVFLVLLAVDFLR